MTPENLGRKKLIAAGLPARAAQECSALAKRMGFLLSLARAQALAAMPPADREMHARQWATIAPPPAAPAPAKNPAPSSKVVAFKNPTAAPLVKNLDRPQPNGGALKTGKGAEEVKPPRPARPLAASEFEGRSLADEIRFIASEVSRARASYTEEQSLADPNNEEDTSAVAKALSHYLNLTKTYAMLTGGLESAAELGDTRSLSSVLESIGKAGSLIKTEILALPDQLQTKLAAMGPEYARSSIAAKVVCEELAMRLLESLKRNFDKMSSK